MADPGKSRRLEISQGVGEIGEGEHAFLLSEDRNQKYFLRASKSAPSTIRRACKPAGAQIQSARPPDLPISPIQGQAQLEFYVIDGDHHQVANYGTRMVPNVKTKQPYHGNFLEFTVVDVTPAPAP